MRTLEWDEKEQRLLLIDQRLIPGRLECLVCRSAQDVAEAIRQMAVRGAPVIGVAAAYGIVLASIQYKGQGMDGLKQAVHSAASLLQESRPTAVNLAWAIRRLMDALELPANSVEDVRQRFLSLASLIADEDVATNKRISEAGEPLIQDGDTLIHHCNTGALATVDWGTALGVIRLAYEKGKRFHVLVDETRPRLQGARLTAWELQQLGISFEIISDGAAGYFLRRGEVQRVFFGADRVAANGDVANKVGSYMLALAAHANNVPVYSAFPTSTVDLTIASGNQIPIEERDESEVLDIQLGGQQATPTGAHARNPAFDVTPNHLITGWITEKGIISSPFEESIYKMMPVKNTG